MIKEETRLIYICDISGKTSRIPKNFIFVKLWAGREFDGCHQYEDVWKTYHIHVDEYEKHKKVIESSKSDSEKIDYIEKLQRNRLYKGILKRK